MLPMYLAIRILGSVWTGSEGASDTLALSFPLHTSDAERDALAGCDNV